MAWNQRKERGEGEPSMWSGFQSGKFSVYRGEEGIVKLPVREGTWGEGSSECSQCFQRASPFLPRAFPCSQEVWPPTRRPVMSVGRRAEASGVRREVLGLHLNFPAHKPSHLPCPFSLHVTHTPLFWVWTNGILPWWRMTQVL